MFLYTRTNCHLCDVAKEFLLNQGVKFTEIDISDDDNLEVLYGLEIPVLVKEDRILLKGIFTEDDVKNLVKMSDLSSL